MKRPRRPAKKTARKAVPKRKRSRKKLRAQADKLIAKLRVAVHDSDAFSAKGWRIVPQHVPMSPEDAAIFDIPQPPPGFAYQWSSVTAVFGMELKGWSRVPFSRHPEIGKERNFDGYIVYRDMTLFQIAADLVEMKLSAGRKKAQSLTLGNEALKAMAAYATPGYGAIREFPILSSIITSGDYERPADPGTKVIDLAIKFEMNYRWRDAAAALGLDESEYVRRRLLMSEHLLAPQPDGTYAVVTLSTTKTED